MHSSHSSQRSQNPRDYLYYFAVDGVISKIGAINSPEDLLQKGFWVTRRPIYSTIGYLQEMIDEGYDVRFLVPYFPQAKGSKNDRIRWLMEQFEYIEDYQYILLPFGTDKSQYAKWNTVLVSTSAEELRAWEQKGGLCVQAEAEKKLAQKLWRKATLNLTVPFDASRLLRLALAGKRISTNEQHKTMKTLEQRQKDFVTQVEKGQTSWQ